MTNVSKGILLTGSTGILGSRTLLELLSELPTIKIYCLVRGEDKFSELKRILDAVSLYDTSGVIVQSRFHQIIPVTGKISEPRFGMTDFAYLSLVDKIDAVIHIAANTSLFETYQRLFSVNVEGTRQVAQFCIEANARMIYTSTYAVMGDYLFKKGYIFYEADLNIGQHFSKMPYAKTKMEAEELIHSFSSKGLRWVITRPGNILGDSETGVYPLNINNINGIYYDIFKTVIETSIALFTSNLFDITPVNYVAKALVALLQHPNVEYKTFHLTNQSILFYDLMNMIVACGFSMQFYPLDVYNNLFKNNLVKINGKTYHSNFASFTSYWRNIFWKMAFNLDRTNTEAYLNTKDITRPEVNQNLIEKYLDYSFRVGYIHPPKPKNQYISLSSSAIS